MSKYDIPYVRTHEHTKIVGIENITFGKNIIIDDFTFIYARAPMTIGDHVHIACFTSIVGGEELEVGSYTAISHGNRILMGTDDFKGWGFGNSTIDEKYRNVKRAPIKIGRFCILGANCVVLPGVTIADGVTVGANSVVTRDLEPWGVYLGNKRISDRDRTQVLKTYEQYLEDQK